MQGGKWLYTLSQSPGKQSSYEQSSQKEQRSAGQVGDCCRQNKYSLCTPHIWPF